MKKQLIILSLALIATLGFYSCKKIHTIIPAPIPTSTLRDSLQLMTNENYQIFTVSSTTGGSFTTKSGVIYTVPANAFRDAANELIVGLIDIEIIEMITLPDMIINNRPTTSNGDVLVTGGQFKISYSVNGNPVLIGGGLQIDVSVPTLINDTRMKLFFGNEDANGFVNWEPALDSTILKEPIPVDVLGDSTYKFKIDSLSANWINCDYFYSVPGSKTGLTLKLDEDYNNANTLFFIYFNTIQSLMTGYFDGNNFVSAGQIPAGTSVKLIFMSEIDENYYYKELDVAISNGYSGSITMDPSSYDDIMDNIKAL